MNNLPITNIHKWKCLTSDKRYPVYEINNGKTIEFYNVWNHCLFTQNIFSISFEGILIKYK